MKRILVVIGTRPEAIKLFPVVHALRRVTSCDVRVCTSGQHRDLVTPVLELAGIRPDVTLDPDTHDGEVNIAFSTLVRVLDRAIAEERPDWVLIQGDTATAFAAGTAAYGRRVRVGHVEAGLRSGALFDPWPEEGYRRALTGLCQLHFAPTALSRDALLKEGVGATRVFETGNTVIDALLWVRDRIAHEPALVAAADAVIARTAGKRLILATAHRRENHGEGIAAIGDALARLSQRADVAIVAPRHPNPRASSSLHAKLASLKTVERMDALDYPNFIRLLERADMVLTDSGGVQEEAPVLGTPVIVMRNTTERREAVAEGTAIIVGADADRIVEAAERILGQRSVHSAMSRAHSPFGDGQAAVRIAQIMAKQFG